MKIVLLAENRKVDLLTNFCIAYKNLLKKHELISLGHIAPSLERLSGLSISGIATDVNASINYMAARAGYNEIDAVIFLKDPASDSYDRSNILMQACDQNNIPYASNLATAEILVLAIDRGDLDWRELVK
ncbi:methylglyoxal synthase [Fastidiosipila sanguinis]|uniref:Methylglyoxal synthase n=1 Tax=Fastidiosipila sanguinis TaxID=236753 RepID=A0A2S0KMQ4_9FIRM|nr:methylglyoxal synthase [Fastidiosipila sanguinis]AVM42279.1 methylglyoxal synthase [Fastidiosipila sanguinis]